MGKLEGKRAPGRPRRTCENSTEADLYEIRWRRSMILLSLGVIVGLLPWE